MIDFLTANNLAKTPIKHGFFTRNGGVSEGLYASLNCAGGTGDVPEQVAENRRRIEHQLGGEILLKPHQVHSANAVIVDAPWPNNTPAKADALVTATPGCAIGVTTADCAPILFADEKARIIAAAHAGWKGALGGIIENTICAMESLGAARANISAAIGPCIQQVSYEVGAEFYAQFMQENDSYAVFFTPSERDGHYQFNLPAFVQAQLAASNITNIMALPNDTRMEEKQFFSYRRSCLNGEPSYGCQLSAVMLSHCK